MANYAGGLMDVRHVDDIGRPIDAVKNAARFVKHRNVRRVSRRKCR